MISVLLIIMFSLCCLNAAEIASSFEGIAVSSPCVEAFVSPDVLSFGIGGFRSGSMKSSKLVKAVTDPFSGFSFDANLKVDSDKGERAVSFASDASSLIVSARGAGLEMHSSSASFMIAAFMRDGKEGLQDSSYGRRCAFYTGLLYDSKYLKAGAVVSGIRELGVRGHCMVYLGNDTINAVIRYGKIFELYENDIDKLLQAELHFSHGGFYIDMERHYGERPVYSSEYRSSGSVYRTGFSIDGFSISYRGEERFSSKGKSYRSDKLAIMSRSLSIAVRRTGIEAVLSIGNARIISHGGYPALELEYAIDARSTRMRMRIDGKRIEAGILITL